ncbi:D-alanyl-D-alanine carboxypeptidase family protein [Paenibacillus sp. VCA1]|uniref:D-alanyl-D-alanine carboxypeptidase family protein n=1 Tax=Paenibacillus sp. VCA1 TaxID=3039148 RepID=UPI002871B99E|nr:D-alanyl-D-alanine carboxypeptidase family protein [Paenibacillus sp. VCA1]MDR9852097.1 D-alanyl-D-alanine carboxypeptidase family protein [Paenibacillus sp. VCA1]
MMVKQLIRLQPKMVRRGPLALINREHPLRQPIHSGYLEPVQDIPLASTEEKQMRLERTCLRQLDALLAACGGKERIGIVSGYRTRMEQQRIYDRSYVENGPIFTASYVARPGESEHQTGLAVDVGELNAGVDYICPSFPDHGVYKEFRRRAAEHGFIQRYQEGKEHLTHIACEPWHFRYVGIPHAVIMEQYGMCLEEYTEYMRQFTPEGPHLFKKYKNHLIEMYVVEIGEEDKEIAIRTEPGVRVEISGNNVNGCVVTIYHGCQGSSGASEAGHGTSLVSGMEQAIR